MRFLTTHRVRRFKVQWSHWQRRAIFLLGGIAIGGLIAGLTVTLIGLRYALLANGLLATAACVVLGRFWLALPALAISKDIPSTSDGTRPAL